MAIYFGNSKIKDIYLGSQKIKEVYNGSELVYTAHDPRGYWVHKDTGVITYFDLTDPFITNGILGSSPWASNCSEVKLPSGLTGLADNTFGGNSSLTSITLSESLISLGSGCFAGCSSLPSITIPEGVTSIGDGCFYWCTSLTLATVLPAVPPSIPWGVFDGVHSSFNIKVRSPYVNAYKTATNWTAYASKISAI